jgi:hypothetical protein
MQARAVSRGNLSHTFIDVAVDVASSKDRKRPTQLRKSVSLPEISLPTVFSDMPLSAITIDGVP